MRLRALLVLMVLAVGGCMTAEQRSARPDPQAAVRAYVDLGLGYWRAGDVARAKENLQRALAIDARSALAHNGLGLVFQLEDEPQLAEQHFRRAIALDRQLAAARNNYGAFLFARQRYEDAIRQFEQAVADPFYERRHVAYENLGVCYLRTGDVARARQAFQRALAGGAPQPRALLELASMAYDERRYAAARDFHRRHREVAEQSARSLWLGIRIARIFEQADQEASYALLLRNVFPASTEYRAYEASLR